MLGTLLIMHEGSSLILALIYWIAGASGTAFRVALSPTLEFGWNRRTIIEILVGGFSGIVITFLGFAVFVNLGLPTERLEALHPVTKASLVLLLNYSGSFTLGEFLARRAKKEREDQS